MLPQIMLPVRKYLLLGGLIAFFGAGELVAQTSVPTSDAERFLGQWTVTLEAEQPMRLMLDIRDADGQVAATITREDESQTVVQNISTTGERSLVLDYTLDMQGQQAPIKMTLTPETHTGNLLVQVDVAGMAVLEGTGASSAERS